MISKFFCLSFIIISFVYGKGPFIGSHGVHLDRKQKEEVLFSPPACEEYYGTYKKDFNRIVSKIDSKKHDSLKDSYASTDISCPRGYKIKCKKQKRVYRNAGNKYVEIYSHYYFLKNVSISVKKFFKHIHTEKEPCEIIN